jgi:alkaline phosphatase D
MRTRRDFLKHASLTSAGLLVGCGTTALDEAPEAPGLLDDDVGGPLAALEERATATVHTVRAPIPPETVLESALFPLGVAAGDVHDDVVTLWTRYDGTAPLSLAVWRMAETDDQRYEREHVVLDTPPREGFVHARVSGLRPGARYRYAFFELADGERTARSLVGRFRAPPAREAAPKIVLAATACTKHGKSFEPLARAAEMGDVDAFLFLGDTAYCDGARSLGEYRAKWQEHFQKPESVALRASTVVHGTWDDHEVDNGWNPERTDQAQIVNARDAFFEHLPLERDEAAPGRIWRSRRIGRSAEIFVLDCRSERKPSTIFTNDEIYISREQMDWLKEGLLQSPCAFKVIMNSVPITRFPNVWNTWQVDRWDAYDSQRTEILSHIDEHAIPGVLWVSGDFHLAKMGRVSPDGVGASQLEVLVGPGAQIANPLLFSVVAPHFDWVSGVNNVTRMELDPATGVARLLVVNGAGEVVHEARYELA